MLMKEGKKEEAEIAKQRVAEIKEVNKAIPVSYTHLGDRHLYSG